MLKQYSKHIAGSIAITGVLALAIILKKPTNPYQQRYLQVRAEIASKVDWAKQLISEYLHLSDDEQTTILHSTIKQLQQFMFNKQYTVLQILLTYINRTIQIAFAKNYVCDVCFQEAVQQAKHCDQLIAEDPNNVNRQDMPLFGIPITIKDTFIAPGTYQTFCVASRTKKRHTEHGIQSYLLEKAGGIVFAKGNLPQFGFSFESDNYLFGRSQHPTHAGRSSGGSSGGDAGLLATDCTAMALGSDSGGSIRIPAHFCGLYGYKPSMKRLNMRGQAKGVGAWDGIRNIGSCYGPMGRHFDDLIPVMEALTINLESAPVAIKDINFYMAPFQKQLCYSTNKLRIGVLRSIDMMLPSTACQRALQLAVDKLAAAGHEIVEMAIDQKLLERAYQIAFHVFLGDGGMRATEELYEGEPMIHHFDVFRSATQSKLRRFKQWLLRLQDRKRELIIWEAGDHGLSYYEMSNLTAELAGLQMQMHNIWEQQKIDGIVSPVTASVAVKHDTAMKCFTSICYTFVWNMLDYSAGAVPITTVQADEQSYNEESKYGCKDIEYKTVQHIMEGSVGLPVGVQVISRPLQDEMCLNIMRQCV